MTKDPSVSPKPKRKYYKPPHRMRNHHEAHRDAAAASVPPVLDHPRVPANQPEVVTDQATLDALLDGLAAAGSFGYDTEFIGEQSFHPRFCVIQVSTPQCVTLIDALAEIDLSRFWAMLGDASVEKIVHAGRQDLEPTMRFARRTPANVFDVQVAAAFAGCPYPSSLGKLVIELAGADTGHGLKFSQWDHRPLSDVQKQYAANDVRYLPLLHDVIRQRVEALGNTAAMEEDLAALERPELYVFDPLGQKLRAKGVGALGRRKQAVLTALMAWRGQTAAAEDMPPRMLVRDDVVMALVEAEIASPADLLQVKGLPRPVREDFSDQIVAAIQSAQNSPLPEKVPRLARLTPTQERRIEALWQAIHQACEGRGIAPGVALAKRDVVQFVRDTTGRAELPESPLLRGWRGELFGELLRASLVA